MRDGSDQEACASAGYWTGSSTTSSWRGENCEEAETSQERTSKPWTICSRVVVEVLRIWVLNETP